MVTIIRQYGRAVLLGITALFVFGAVCAVRSGENTGDFWVADTCLFLLV